MWLKNTPGWPELWIERFPTCHFVCIRAFTSVIQHLRDHGTFKSQTHDRGRDIIERILQVEEQILERVEEKPDISTRRLAAEVGLSQFVVHSTYIKRVRPTSIPRS